MTELLWCHHGHRFKRPEHARRYAVCPLCGAVTWFRQDDVETKGQEADQQTIEPPGSSNLGGLQDDDQQKTLGIDYAGNQAPGFLPTGSYGPPPSDNDGGPDSLSELQDGRTGAHERPPDQAGARHVADDGAVDKQAPDQQAPDDAVTSGDQAGEATGPGQPNAAKGPGTNSIAGNKTIAIRRTVSLDGSEPAGAAADPPETDRHVIPPTIRLPTIGDDTNLTQRDGVTEEPPSTNRDLPGTPESPPPNVEGYFIVEEIGRGGMGVVYRAIHEKYDREVALKTVLDISPVELQRFKQEFRSLADIAHENLATLHDLVADGDRLCFTMELLEAVDFTEYVWSGFKALHQPDDVALVGQSLNGAPRLTPEVRERLYAGLKQLVLGLNALHNAGMLHRDIKPSNVLVTTEGRVALVDFGLASQFKEDATERPTGIHGTPEYMSPEQAACESLAPASDWYAVGVMIYEVLTGHFPFGGKPLQVIVDKQNKTPPPPRELEHATPPQLNNLCAGLLSKDPEKRPTAADVLRCIGAEDLIASLSISARVGAGQAVELVGREVHLKGLHASFRQVGRGMTKSIFVHGESGMGKSVLIQKFLSDLRKDDRAVILAGRCYEQESVPFKALDNLIDSLADYLTGLPEADARQATPEDLLPLVRLFPVLGQIPGALDPGRPSIENVDQQELRQRAMNALREMLKHLSKTRPVVLYIDDLQWGDEDSADLLADLVRPPDAPRVLVLGSFRTENRDTSLCLQALDKAYTTGRYRPRREEMVVDSLPEADAKRLALMLLRRHDPGSQILATKIARESRGWPFFVWELAQHVQDSPEIADQSLELDEVIWTRVQRLPNEVRQLLELVAVTGRPLPALEAYQAIACQSKGRNHLAQLRACHFVRTTGDEDDETIVETYHDRIRESVVANLEREEIQQYSLQLANTFEAGSGIEVADLWSHINRTQDDEEPGAPYPLDKQQWQRVFDLARFYDAAAKHKVAFPFALCAAEQARQQDAQEVAEQQYRIALHGESEVSSGLRLRVHEGLGDVLVLRGRYEEAIEQFRAARLLTQRHFALARLDAKLGAAAFKKGDMGVARDYQEKALSAMGERLPGNRVSLYCGLAKEGLTQLLHTYFPGHFVGRRRLDSPRSAADLFRVRVFDELTITNWFTQPMHMVLWSHLRGLNLGELYPPSQELGRTYAFHAITMTGIPRAQRGIAYAKKAYQISVDKGDLWGQGKARGYHTFSCIVLARFNEGVRTGKEAVRLLEEAGDVWEANMARMIATVPLFHLGNLKAAYLEAKKAYEIGIETGDYSAACISLLFWIPAAPQLIPPGAIQTELERVRIDPLAITGAAYARGLELLLREDEPLKAAEALHDCLARAKARGLRNVCIFSAATWKATALRIAAERATDALARRRLLKQAGQAVSAALWITNSYRASRPQALREAGTVAALEGKSKQARRYFDDSLQVATHHEARYDHALTSLARGEFGMKFNWPDAEREAEKARRSVAAIENLGDP